MTNNAQLYFYSCPIRKDFTKGEGMSEFKLKRRENCPTCEQRFDLSGEIEDWKEIKKGQDLFISELQSENLKLKSRAEKAEDRIKHLEKPSSAWEDRAFQLEERNKLLMRHIAASGIDPHFPETDTTIAPSESCRERGKG